jgi:hypothetical protein
VGLSFHSVYGFRFAREPQTTPSRKVKPRFI